MITNKPISTISYNTEEFLSARLAELRQNCLLEEYAYIRHKPDTDGTKFHFHVFMLPTKKVDTELLRLEFTECVPDEVKPLGCMPIVNSEFVNWTLYCIHDLSYLSKKGLHRTFHYSLDDIQRSSNDWFKFECANIPQDKGEVIFELLSDGYTPLDLLKNGIIKLSDYQNCLRAYNDILELKEREFRQKLSRHNVYLVDFDGNAYCINRAKLHQISKNENEIIFNLYDIGRLCEDFEFTD